MGNVIMQYEITVYHPSVLPQGCDSFTLVKASTAIIIQKVNGHGR